MGRVYIPFLRALVVGALGSEGLTR
jgi:hypothetical protein